MATHDHDYVSCTSNSIDEDNISDNTGLTDGHVLNSGSSSGNWQTVTPRHTKRNLSTSPENGLKRHRADIAAAGTSSAKVPLRNHYEPLSNSMDEEALPPRAEVKDAKPPPIFLPGVTKVVPMIQALDAMVSKSGYSYKCLNQDKMKLFPTTPDDYRKIVRGLTDLNVSFHTFQLKQERAYRVVLKNMHYSTPIEDLKSAIEEHGHKVRNLTNALNRFTKKPLSIFFIDLEPSARNKEIFQIQFLLNAKISFEPPMKRREVVQCKRCQRYGHTKAYCHNTFRCVKCTQEHDTKDCPKPPLAPPTCVLCSGEHPASYKGCPAYKEVRDKQFPPLRKKSPGAGEGKQDASPNTARSNQASTSLVTDGVTFAQATSRSSADIKADSNKVPPGPETHEQVTGSLNDIIQNSFARFEHILSKQAEQISTLLNLLTTVLSRLK
jgi:hypothetical protein